MNIKIETENLILRKIELKDAEIFHHIRNEEHILKWMPDWKSTLEETKSWIMELNKFYDNQTEEDLWCQLAVERKSDRAILGLVALQTKVEVNNEVELAYFLSEKYQGKGYMIQAVNAILSWGIEKFNLSYVMAIVEVSNYPSQKVVQRAGFKNIETRMILNSGEKEEKPFYYYRVSKETLK